MNIELFLVAELVNYLDMVRVRLQPAEKGNDDHNEYGEEGIGQFCKRWRQAFVEAIHPRSLPAAAAEAAITVLCDESSCPREIFDVDDHLLTIGTQPCELERELDQDDVEMKERLHQSGHDSETWGLAAPDAFEPVPQIC
ncbi:hypothetical protein ACFE04_028590 [Oxalis oulophora]